MLGNTKDLVFKRESTSDAMLKTLADFATSSNQTLREGFIYAYIQLLKSLAKNDHTTIGNCCETNLYKGFASSLDKLKSSKYKLELMNDQANNGVHMELIDFQNIIGVDISRA